MSNVGFIGVGWMGFGIANNILKNNHELFVIANKNRKPIDRIVKEGAKEVKSYEEKDKFTAQGLNDFIVFSTQGIGSLSAGFLLYFSNWTVINLLCVPLLIIVLVVSFISSRNN